MDTRAEDYSGSLPSGTSVSGDTAAFKPLHYHFSIVGETLLKHPVQEDRGERCRAVA